MRLAQLILQVVLVRARKACESPTAESTTAGKAAQWPVLGEDKKKTKKIPSFWHRAAPVPDLYLNTPGQNALWVGPRHKPTPQPQGAIPRVLSRALLAPTS